MEKLQLATIKVGNLEFEGLQNDVGQYFIAMSQIAKLFSVPQKHISRDLSKALGGEISYPKMKTKLNSKEVRVLPYLHLIDVTKYYLSKGSEQALTINNSLLGLSLKVLFDDAFGVENTKEGRQDFLKSLQMAKTMHSIIVQAGCKHLGWKTQYDHSAGMGEFHKRFCGRTSLGDKDKLSGSELERYNEQATLTAMYIKSGYDLQEALNKVFN